MISGGPSLESYRLFSLHQEECETCRGISELVTSTHRPKLEIRRLFAGACEEGQRLLWEWDTTVQDRVQAPETTWVARRMGVWHEWEGREERVEALLAIPRPEFDHILYLDDDRAREAEIGAIVRGFRPRAALVTIVEADVELCRYCDKPLGSKQIADGRDSHYACWKARNRT